MVPRIVFVGTPEFAVPSLEALVGWNKEAVVAAVSQPDRPQGRHRPIIETPVKRAARKRGLPILQPVRIKSPEARPLIESLAPDLVIVVAYGQILPKWLLDIPRFGALNVHASLLPRYRGAAPLQRALLNGERATGITLMRMDEGMDTGPVISQVAFSIGDNETAGELASRASILAADFLLAELPGYLDGRKKPLPQDSSQATYAPLLRKEEGAMQFELLHTELHNRVRAMNPWPTAWCQCQGQALMVHRTRLPAAAAGAAGRIPGELIGFDRDAMVVQCGTGRIALWQVQAPGKRIVSGRDLANGLRLEAGFRFTNG
ncbi:MAG: methionyl-tRNA formyltransferase [Acidobacteria bacterium]|nr:methionyl-tRNA formyltransferase [Acidobacteriota bacterium]